MKRPCCFLLLCLPLLSGSCSQPSPVAGGGGVIGNPPIAGVVKDKEGRSVAYARVSLYRTGFNPVSGDTATAVAEADSTGRYILKNVPADTYNLVAAETEGRSLGMVSRIVVPPSRPLEDTVHALGCTLAAPATVTIPLAGLDAVAGGFFYLPGLPVAARIDSTALKRGALALKSVPAGSFAALAYAKDSAAPPVNILAHPLEAKAGADALVGTFQAWKYVRKVFINTTTTGAATSETVAGFPLLVRLDSANFDFRSARDSGQDVRILKADGVTLLPCQVARWSPPQAEIWVRVDTIRADEDSQFVYLIAGKDSIGAVSRGEAVFDTAGNFVAAWHWEEDPAATQPAYLDATAFGNHGSSVGPTPPSRVEGVVGAALSLDGKTQYIRVPDAASLDFTAFTFCAWIKPDSFGGRILDKITSGGQDGYAFDTYEGRIRVAGAGVGATGDFSGRSLPTGRFLHLAATFDGRSLRFFMDGLPGGETDSLLSVPANDFDLLLGSSQLGLEKFGGIIDEVHLSRTARSASWIKLSYENQKPGSTVISVE